MNKSRPSPASSNGIISDKVLSVHTNSDVGEMLHLSALEVQLNYVHRCFIFLSNTHFNTALLSSSTILAQKQKLGTTVMFMAYSSVCS
jgi:hypothetical protein